MYGYCGHSGLVEAATGTLQNWLRSFRKKVDPLELLQVAVLVAHGVADMHLYHNGMPTVAHADIKVSQFLMIKSGRSLTFKINDFNRGRFLTSQNPPEICPFYIGGKHKGSTSRAPEEYKEGGALTDKIDVFSLGSVLYYILTGEAPFEKEVVYAHAIANITSGVDAPLPKAVEHSADPSIIAIVDTMQKCRQLRAEDRPNSREVANLLTEALGRIIGHTE
jgi:serine/threonine protein kinase